MSWASPISLWDWVLPPSFREPRAACSSCPAAPDSLTSWSFIPPAFPSGTFRAAFPSVCPGTCSLGGDSPRCSALLRRGHGFCLDFQLALAVRCLHLTVIPTKQQARLGKIRSQSPVRLSRMTRDEHSYWVYWAKPLPSNLPVLNRRVGRPTELQVSAPVRCQENRRQMIRRTMVILT